MNDIYIYVLITILYIYIYIHMQAVHMRCFFKVAPQPLTNSQRKKPRSPSGVSYVSSSWISIFQRLVSWRCWPRSLQTWSYIERWAAIIYPCIYDIYIYIYIYIALGFCFIWIELHSCSFLRYIVIRIIIYHNIYYIVPKKNYIVPCNHCISS